MTHKSAPVGGLEEQTWQALWNLTAALSNEGIPQTPRTKAAFKVAYQVCQDRLKAEWQAAPPPPDLEKLREEVAGPDPADTPLMAAAREAGWALLENVDSMPWERRGQVVAIAERLAAALLSHRPVEGDQASDRIKELEEVVGDLSGYAQHDNDCAANLNEPCDCGYSDVSRRARNLIQGEKG